MWIKTKAKFRVAISDTEWDIMDEDQQEDACVPRLFRFNTDDLYAYNESRVGGATIRLKHGYDISIEITVQEIDKIIFGKD